MPYSAHGYHDPLHIVWRKGTEDDPYLDRVEWLKVLNHRVVLSEIPDRFTRVKIAGMKEINYDGVPKKNIAPNEFWVNYSNGVIEVHPSREADNLNISYKGKGFIQYPSSRIYHQDEFNNVVLSLEEVIDNALQAYRDVDDKIADYQEVRDDVLEQLYKTEQATLDSKKATEEAIIATDKANDAYESTRLVFKPYVQTKNEIYSKYPSPELGWTTQVYDTGIRYRWDGIQWVPIDLFGGNIPLANATTNGLMSKEDKVKLDSYDDRIKDRVVVFVVPQYPDAGVQHVFARFPFKGEITNIKALCGTPDPTMDTEIAIQRSKDMVNWTNVMNRNLVIKAKNHFDDGLRLITSTPVAKDEIFRLEFLQLGTDLQDVTVEIHIKVV